MGGDRNIFPKRRRNSDIPAVDMKVRFSSPVSPGRAAEKAGARSFLRCGGWACSLTATELQCLNTTQAWAIGRTTKQDAHKDCGGREGLDFARCVAEQTARPPVVINADCENGTVSAGYSEDYKISDRARKGELPHAENRAFWEKEMSHREQATVITWFRFLCPQASAKWHVRPEP